MSKHRRDDAPDLKIGGELSDGAIEAIVELLIEAHNRDQREASDGTSENAAIENSAANCNLSRRATQ